MSMPPCLAQRGGAGKDCQRSRATNLRPVVFLRNTSVAPSRPVDAWRLLRDASVEAKHICWSLDGRGSVSETELARTIGPPANRFARCGQPSTRESAPARYGGHANLYPLNLRWCNSVDGRVVTYHCRPTAPRMCDTTQRPLRPHPFRGCRPAWEQASRRSETLRRVGLFRCCPSILQPHLVPQHTCVPGQQISAWD